MSILFKNQIGNDNFTINNRKKCEMNIIIRVFKAIIMLISLCILMISILKKIDRWLMREYDE